MKCDDPLCLEFGEEVDEVIDGSTDHLSHDWGTDWYSKRLFNNQIWRWAWEYRPRPHNDYVRRTIGAQDVQRLEKRRNEV